MTFDLEVRSPFTSAETLVFFMPVALLTVDAAVGGVPAAVVHGLLLTVDTLKNKQS